MKLKLLTTVIILLILSNGVACAVSTVKLKSNTTPEAIQSNLDIEITDNVKFRDDFDEYSTNWRILSEFTSFNIHHGLAELTLWKAWRFTYFNIGINSVERYQYDNFEMRAQVNNSWRHVGKEDDIGPGSVGWGFWNKKFDSSQIEVAWFFHNKASRFSPMNGLWAVCKSPSSNPHGGFTKIKIEGIDITNWHVYAINWTEDYCDFYIDGENVAHITNGIPVKASCVNLWNDNAVWYALPRANLYLPIIKRSPKGNILFLDYIEITD